MQGSENVKFVIAQQAKQKIAIKEHQYKNCTKQTQQHSLIKHVGRNI